MGYSGKNTNMGGLEVEDTEFSRVLMNWASGNSREIKTNMEFPWVLVFGLQICNGCETIL